ncbi:hypothetical protein BO70DRAFT_285 [Aspergillus heteromorphus CBS 117.55]|uniref:Uncharacterized protein n=1 Tax=Aspergillus heteromorphus CBS 117.55 TaxID=1448321 RepID=A0A317X126_9EURO|nr:uncharacterized protein BO70DRAFT_285 [Aspergillus heteromorphus CBS 117.55]PWY92005.1 hypothetical protein BO70DRAFT_285 [Aspergillus heteromorphus CBS 117.55]
MAYGMTTSIGSIPEKRCHPPCLFLSDIPISDKYRVCSDSNPNPHRWCERSENDLLSQRRNKSLDKSVTGS